MQHFAIARQYKFKNHHFSHDVALLFWVLCKLVCCPVQKISNVPYSCNIKGTCVPCNILFTEFNVDKK